MWNWTILAAGVLLTISPYPSLRAQGTPGANLGWYNGDCHQGTPGAANGYWSDQQFYRTFEEFAVPGGGWTIAGVFSTNAMTAVGITEAVWEIRSGLSSGSNGTVVASGRSPATQTLSAAWPDGETFYRVEVDGLSVQLAPGTYWLNVSPVVDFDGTYVCGTSGANSIGSPPGNSGTAFFDYCILNGPFQPLSEGFSLGVLISSAARPAPAIAAVVNAASWLAGAVSPGELITIAGSALGPAALSTSMLDQNGRVSTSLDGVSVLFGGFYSPEIFVSAGQINAVVPYEVASTATTVQVVAAGQASSAFPVTVAAAAPALFTSNGSGAGPAAALNQDYSYNGPANPAAKGSYVMLYLTGEGLTAPAGVTGAVTTVAATAPITPQPALPVKVFIGGQAAYVEFAGEAPGEVSGVLQVNVQIPANAPSGNLPLSVSVGGYTTPSGVTISVQ
jgi:uncharacterized protein (TIGR03437 family)